MSFSLDREVLIRARRALVFQFFTDSARFAQWWGAGSSIEPREGGAVRIRYPNGVLAGGVVRALEPPTRVVFTYGYEDPSKPIAWGASLVTVTFAEEPHGTRVKLVHEVDSAPVRDAHVPGWRYQLAVFANVAAAAHAEGLEPLLDRYFEAWSEPDAERRRSLVEATCAPDVQVRDGFACVEGREELLEHLQALRAHAPGTLRRAGPVRQCQGTALVDWVVDGPRPGAGTNVVTLTPAGTVGAVVGFWGNGPR